MASLPFMTTSSAHLFIASCQVDGSGFWAHFPDVTESADPLSLIKPFQNCIPFYGGSQTWCSGEIHSNSLQKRPSFNLLSQHFSECLASVLCKAAQVTLLSQEGWAHLLSWLFHAQDFTAISSSSRGIVSSSCWFSRPFINLSDHMFHDPIAHHY